MTESKSIEAAANPIAGRQPRHRKRIGIWSGSDIDVSATPIRTLTARATPAGRYQALFGLGGNRLLFLTAFLGRSLGFHPLPLFVRFWPNLSQIRRRAAGALHDCHVILPHPFNRV